MQEKLNTLYENAEVSPDLRGRKLACGIYLFKKDDGGFRFFQTRDDALSFEFLEDELL